MSSSDKYQGRDRRQLNGDLEEAAYLGGCRAAKEVLAFLGFDGEDREQANRFITNMEWVERARKEDEQQPNHFKAALYPIGFAAGGIALWKGFLALVAGGR